MLRLQIRPLAQQLGVEEDLSLWMGRCARDGLRMRLRRRRVDGNGQIKNCWTGDDEVKSFQGMGSRVVIDTYVSDPPEIG